MCRGGMWRLQYLFENIIAGQGRNVIFLAIILFQIVEVDTHGNGNTLLIESTENNLKHRT